MKRIVSLALIGLFLLSITVACGSSRASCDAYGSVDTTMQDDLAQK